MRFRQDNPQEFIDKNRHIFNKFGAGLVKYEPAEYPIKEYSLEDFDADQMLIKETIVFSIDDDSTRCIGIVNCITFVSKYERKRHGGLAKYLKEDWNILRFTVMKPALTFREEIGD